MENGYSNYILNGDGVNYCRRFTSGQFSMLEFESHAYTYGISGDLILWRVRRNKDAFKIKHMHPLEIPGLSFEHYVSDRFVAVSYDLPDKRFNVWVLKDGMWI